MLIFQTSVVIKCFKKLHSGIFCSDCFENFLLMVGTDFQEGEQHSSQLPNE